MDLPKKNTTLMGKILARVHNARYETRAIAERELWKRNGLDNPTKRDGYKLAETASVARDGTEVVEYRLYKLIDRAQIIISSDVRTTTHFGLEDVPEEEPSAG